MKSLVLALAFAAAQPPEARKTDSQTILPVVPDALDLTQSESQGGTSVEYAVRESYPARKTIAYLMDRMAQRGWKVTEVGMFRPPQWTLVPPVQPSRQNISGVLRATPVASHVWQGWWRDASGRGATLELEYRCPMEEQGLHSVWLYVRGTVYGPAEAARQQAERKRVHDELCQAARDSGLSLVAGCEK